MQTLTFTHVHTLIDRLGGQILEIDEIIICFSLCTLLITKRIALVEKNLKKYEHIVKVENLNNLTIRATLSSP